ncbi:MAG TPA: hypothetical protein VGF48_13475 [Thermoanaerobaculia bacterium]|jgi:DUF4097 and DUF4098 domain-containing protein YvlB
MRTFAAAAVLVLSASAFAQQQGVTRTQRYDQKFTLGAGGTFVIENPLGNIDILGTDEPNVTAVLAKTVVAVDKEAGEEGWAQTKFSITGDENTRVVKVVLPAVRKKKWTSTVAWVLRVPRSVHVKVHSGASERVRISNIRGNVFVKNVNGNIVLQNVGPATADSVNGTILYDALRPSANANLSTVNGHVHVVVGPDANFSWNAETLTGDVLSTLPVRGSYNGTSYSGRVNAPGGPTINATSMMRNVYFLRRGTQPPQAASVRTSSIADLPSGGPPVIGPARPVNVQQVVQGSYIYRTNIGDVRVREVRGNARIATGAGLVELGTVVGNAYVTSQGGPIHLGEIFGTIEASTHGGDILVDAAREGGRITTDGGIIRVLYNGGPTTLFSGGGDIVVRQAAGPVNAETRSGDISITVDPNVRSQRVDAKTAKGNVVLNVSPRFGAEIDATILTSDSNANTITSDLQGLSIRKEEYGGKTRIRATGKIGSGGEKVTLTTEDGGIQINSRATTPMTVIRPRQ